MIRIERLTQPTHADASDLERLYRLLNPSSSAVTLADLTLLCRADHAFCFVVRNEPTEDGVRQPILGTATLVVNPRARGVVAELYDVVVDTRHRGRGLGKALLQNVTETASRSNAYHIELRNGPMHADARLFYKKLGFEQRDVLTLRLTLT